MFDRRLIQNFDWPLLVISLVITLIGILNLYSATFSQQNPVWIRQMYWFLVGYVAVVIVFALNYQRMENFAYYLFGISVLLLVLVLFFGKIVSGSKRWIELGFVSFQPSELVKITFILALARYFSKNPIKSGYSLRDLFIPFLLLIVPFCLIIVEPDLGTALVLCIIFASILLFAGVRWQSLLTMIIGLVLTLPAGWFFLKDYQRARVLAFLDPGHDPLGAGYHTIQSKIAVGSGLLWGKGFLNGTQTQLNFLPEHHTDFIFSVLAEEWGFFGSSVLIGLYMALIFRGLTVAKRSKDRFGTIVAVGIVCLIFWQMVINIGMTIGLLPVVGAPLPLISYGGSSVVSTLIGVGILLNISSRRFMFQSGRLGI
jgi:rod shape determining protein RodA